MIEEQLEEINSIAEFMEKLNNVKELERYKNLEFSELIYFTGGNIIRNMNLFHQ